MSVSKEDPVFSLEAEWLMEVLCSWLSQAITAAHGGVRDKIDASISEYSFYRNFNYSWVHTYSIRWSITDLKYVLDVIKL